MDKPDKPPSEPACYTQGIDKVLSLLETDRDGLSDAESLKRLQKYGKNELGQRKRRSFFAMLFAQLKDAMVLILIAAIIVSLCFSEFVQAGVIALIVIIDAAIGIIQERKAESSLEALRKMSAPTARAMRQGEESIIPASDIVVGDIVFLDDGQLVPADIRLTESSNLHVQQASLTGESVPCEKDADDIVSIGCPLADRSNMVYASSLVTYGRGVGVVTATGMDTEVGKVAGMLQNQDDLDTPLKRKLEKVGKTLSIAGLVICAVIFGVGALYGREFLPLLMTAIALAISIIPEGLPATATIVLALGVQRMAKRNAIIRKLPAVETLGGTSVIACDKTGTLTQNKMTVTHIAVYGDIQDGKACRIKKAMEEKREYFEAIRCGALCNNAALDPDRPGEILGDPTEGALILLAERFGEDQEEMEDTYARLFEQPFDSDRKRMTTVHKIRGVITAYTKGAVDELLPICTKIRTGRGERDITEDDIEKIRELQEDMSGDALRLLGLAKRSLDEVPKEDDENVEYDLTFIGIVGMIDPPREEVKEAVKTCFDAGIRTVMITGDHKQTAIAIAKDLGIWKKGSTSFTGPEIELMSNDELDLIAKTTSVYARVSPEDKLRIIHSLKRTGEVTAMTGDGVNDAPALKAADIGIAMGVSGTDVAKDASDMILTDDNFTTIVAAVKEGRRVYRNIQKVIQFLLSGNIAEIITLFIATLFNWPAPILAIHILWINLATDTLPALALGLDPAEPDVMKKMPLRTNSLFERSLVLRVLVHGALMAGITLAAFGIGLSMTDDLLTAQTMAFAVLAFQQLVHSFNQRSDKRSAFAPVKEKNPYLWGAIAISAALMLLLMFVPPVRGLFKLTGLDGIQWLIVLGFAFVPLLAVEAWKLFKFVFFQFFTVRKRGEEDGASVARLPKRTKGKK